MQNYERKSDSLTEEICTCGGTLCKRECHLIGKSPGRFLPFRAVYAHERVGSDMHRMSDEYLVRELEEESRNTK